MRYDRLPPEAKPFLASVRAASLTSQLPEELIWAQIAAESAFDPTAKSPAGARGLMQLMPGTALEMAVDPLIPHECIQGGTAYMRRLLRRYGGSLTHSLAAYNMGPGRLGLPAKPPSEWPLETQKYVSKVAKYMAHYMGA